MSSLTLSLDFGPNSRHHRDAIDGVMAEAERRPRPDGKPYESPNIQPERSKNNEHWFNPAFGHRTSNTLALLDQAIMNNITVKKAPRSNAVLMRGLVYKASPDFFFPKIRNEHWSQKMIDDPRLYEARGEIDKIALDNFVKTSFAHCAKIIGGEQNILSYHVHCDEASPHVHFECIPLVTNAEGVRLCNREFIFGNCDKKSDLRRAGAKLVDEAQDFFKNCSTADGTRIKSAEMSNSSPDKSKVPHKTYTSPAQIQQVIEADELRNAMAVTEFMQAEDTRGMPSYDEYAAQVISEDRKTWPDIWSDSGEFSAAKMVKVWNHDRDIIRIQQEYIRSLQADIAMANSKTLHEKTRREAAEKAVENHFKYSRELAKTIRESISCEEVLHSAGFLPVPAESKKYQYVIYQSPGENISKIKVTGPKWYDWQTQQGGGGAIDLYMYLHGCDFKTAFQELHDRFGGSKMAEAAVSHPVYRDVAVEAVLEHIDSEASKPPKLPKRGNNALLAPFLTRLGYRPEQAAKMACHLLDSGQAYIDTRQNLVFPRDGGGYFIQGTRNSHWKQTRGTYKQGCKSAIVTTPATTSNAPLAICADIRDALAYLAIYPAHEAAIIGSSHYALPTPKPGQTIFIATGNDELGKKLSARIRAHYASFGYGLYIKDAFPPTAKASSPQNHIRIPRDWADYLHHFHPRPASRGKIARLEHRVYRPPVQGNSDLEVFPHTPK